MIKGHITICKVYSDGTQETVLDKANLITAGLGSSLVDVQMGLGSSYTDGYAPYYFQVGTNTVDYITKFEPEVSSNFYKLSAPFDWDDYGEDSDHILENRYRGFYASTTGDGVYNEMFGASAALSATVFSGADEYFSTVKEGRITKVFLDSFECEIILDEKDGNGKTISEVGLFSKNPKGLKEDTPVLMAYRSFAGVPKTDEFSLVIHWVVGFLGLSTNIDDHYSGGPPPPAVRPRGR
jgi:hypothetical protein